jgi:large subunit ribosomal protein L3
MDIQGLIGRKIGMTTLYHEDGTADGITLLEIGPCVVTQIRTNARDGYEAVQIGFGEAKHLNKPKAGHLERSSSKVRHLQEFAVGDLGNYEVGQQIDASVFDPGDTVVVRGTSKGRGFAGAVKRYGFHGGPKTHGQSDRHRSVGSIGAGTSPGRVWPGTRMAGHFGNHKTSVEGLEVAMVDAERNLVGVKGGVPGPKNGIIRLEIRTKSVSAEAGE